MARPNAGRCTGPDSIPPNVWKVWRDKEDECHFLLRLCQQCWSEKSWPTSWGSSIVTLLFKKWDASLPESYRPISLLAVRYKVLASILHRRMLDGGSEVRLHSSQFGFRLGRGTTDALSLARRMIDAAAQCREGGLNLLLLAWAKAYDTVKADSLCLALVRFGLPSDFVQVISGIYSERRFLIKDHTGSSSLRPRHSGRAQVSPLSPYFFIAAQLVPMFDVFCRMELEDEQGVWFLADVLYADGTPLFSSSPSNLQRTLGRLCRKAYVTRGNRY